MLRDILTHFPPHTHALTLVSDPDNILADESIAAALNELGFRLIHEPDPAALRHAYVQAQPATAETPLVVVTAGALNELPYDLWQRGHHVELALHRFFPNLDYPTLRLLTVEQRWRLAQAQLDAFAANPLSVKGTCRYLLAHVFGCDLARMSQAGHLLHSLAELHARGDALPAVLVETAVDDLRRRPAFAAWPLTELLADAAAFHRFVQTHWEAYVRSIQEGKAGYAAGPLPFAQDASLQDVLPKLVRSGALTPVQVHAPTGTPAWASGAVVYDPTAAGAQQIDHALDALAERLAAPDPRWNDWTEIAQRWAQVSVWRYDVQQPLGETHMRRIEALQEGLDRAFTPWLRRMYGVLAGQRLPDPHHLYHVPEYLANRRATRARVALVVLDGMSLAAWRQMRPVWQARHPAWRLEERALLAQIPSITAISRQALIAGLPPSRFADSMTHNRREAALWQQFWSAHGLEERSVVYVGRFAKSPYPPPALDSTYTRAICLIANDIDDMVHGATQGLAEVHAALGVWLNRQEKERASGWVEQLIQRLLDHGYLAALASDHGCVEAVGVGVPQEGVTVESRSKRARVYDREHFARSVQTQFPNTQLWWDDGLLPSDRWVLMPQGREAFASPGQVVVSHGGMTIEEMVVPFVLIT